MTDFMIVRIGLAIFATPLSAGFALLIGIYFVLALRYINATHPMQQAIAKNAPTNLTTLGILGTFIGIFIGLLDFDVFAITQSVPQLLAGLKLAFATSILGLMAAFAFKILAPLLDKAPTAPNDGEGAGAEEVIAAIQTLTRQMEQDNQKLIQTLTQTRAQNRTQLEALAKLPSMIEQWNNKTLQWQKDQAAAQTKANQALTQRFAKELTPAISDTLMRQVQQVLDSVSKKLTQESERNFDRIHDALAQSSKALTSWQDNFRDQTIAMREAIDAVNTNISSTRNDIDNIGNLLASIPERLNQQTR